MKKIFCITLCVVLCLLPLIAYAADDDLILRSVNVSNERVTASDANGFKAVMLSLIGDYETVITDYTYQSSASGYYSHSISIERDWSWIWSCVCFIVVVYCFFRSIGGMLKW